MIVCRIGRAHGIRGEVTIEVRTDVPEQRFVPGALLHLDRPKAGVPSVFTVTTVRNHNGTLLLGLDGVTDRNEADLLRGLVLEAEVDAESEEPDAWYDHQLVGLAAVSPVGVQLGAVAAVEHYPVQDLLVIRRPDGEHRLVPFVNAIVPTVDLARGVVVIDAPPGLIQDLPSPAAPVLDDE